MKRLPSQFKLMGHTIRISRVAQKDWKHADCIAYFDPTQNKILILKQPHSIMHHAFWHEVVHSMLNVISHPLYSDENFVDSLGGMLAQIIETAE